MNHSYTKGGTQDTRFKSDKVADPSDENDPVIIVPVLDDTVTYLYVAFRVTASMKVDIKWKVEGSKKHGEINFEDPVDGGNSSPKYWYFAWYKPSGIATVNHTSKIFQNPHLEGGVGVRMTPATFWF